jgi:hypothetical protein
MSEKSRRISADQLTCGKGEFLFNNSSQPTKQVSFSQPSVNTDESSSTHRSQIKFQEFVSRSRHEEIVDLLKNLNGRIINLEERMDRNFVKNFDQGQRVENLLKDGNFNQQTLLRENFAINKNGFVMIHSGVTRILNEVKETRNCCDYIETRLKHAFPETELSIEEYMSWKRLKGMSIHPFPMIIGNEPTQDESNDIFCDVLMKNEDESSQQYISEVETVDSFISRAIPL